MSQSAAVLSKKTKNEILEEYQRLLSSIEDAKIISKSALSQASLGHVLKAKEIDVELIEKEGLKIETEMKAGLEAFLLKILDLRKDLSVKLGSELKKFEDLQSAIDASKQALKNNYNIEVAAESINRLIDEYADKKKELTAEMERIKEESEREQAVKKAEWERKIEEWEYAFKQKKQRLEESLIEETARREKGWQEREAFLKAEEAEVQRLKVQAEKYPATLSAELAKREKEIGERLGADHANAMNFKNQEWKSKEEIYKLQIGNLESQIKKQEAEIIILKKEQELANRKTQEMAVKVIESSAAKYKKTEEQENRQNA